jgi:S-adenosylmethionine hydrolase
MKGVILDLAPEARIVDLTHELPPQDVLAAALALESVLGVFPSRAIHLAVVDPGVGTTRHAVAMRTDQGFFVGPDNGLFTAVIEAAGSRCCVALNNKAFHRRPVSHTFHGRDVFAPVAAHMACGAALEDMGTPLDQPMTLSIPAATVDDKGISACVLAADRFGNITTNVKGKTLEAWRRGRGDVLVEVADRTIPGISRTFADVEPGDPVAYMGSTGRLEIAIRNGHAVSELRIEPRARVVVREGG